MSRVDESGAVVAQRRVLEAYDLVEASIGLADEAQPRRHGDLVVVATQALYHLGNYGRAGELVDRLERDVPAPRDPDMVGGRYRSCAA